MEQLDSLIQQTQGQPEYIAWAIGAAVATALIVILPILRSRLVKGLEMVNGRITRGKQVATAPITLLKGIRYWYFIVFGLFVGSRFVAIPADYDQYTLPAFLIITFIQVAMLVTALINNSIEKIKEIKLQHEPDANVGAISFAGFIARMGVWVVVFLLALDNLGFDITALVAGLGIGGIAIGMAAQNVLSDMFATLSIILDRPFAVGDFVVAGDVSGTVKSIGLKTTRIQSANGEMIVVSNNDLLGSRIRNYYGVERRRSVNVLGVEYGTEADKLEQIKQITREAVESVEFTTFDRCNFVAYADFSLNFELVYFVEKGAYADFLAVQEQVNFKIYRAFAEVGIEFAFPTQTVHLVKA